MAVQCAYLEDFSTYVLANDSQKSLLRDQTPIAPTLFGPTKVNLLTSELEKAARGACGFFSSELRTFGSEITHIWCDCRFVW